MCYVIRKHQNCRLTMEFPGGGNSPLSGCMSTAGWSPWKVTATREPPLQQKTKLLLFEWETYLGYSVLSVFETAILAPLLAWQQSGNHLLQQPKPGTQRSCWRALLLRSQHVSAAKHDYSQMDEPGGRLQPSTDSHPREKARAVFFFFLLLT